MRSICIFILVLFSDISEAQIKKTYENKSPNFSVKYPDDWKNKVKEGGRVFFTSPVESDQDTFSENINIGYRLNKDKSNIADLGNQYESLVEYIKPSFNDFKLISHEVLKVNNEKVLELAYEGKLKSQETILLHFTQRFSFNNGYLFTLTLTELAGVNKWHTKAVEIMNSLKFN